MKDYDENSLNENLKESLEKNLNVNINRYELKKIIKEYKKIKKFRKSSLYEVMQIDKKTKKS